MPIPPGYYTSLNQYLRDELGTTDADKIRLDLQMGANAGGQPLGSFESMHGIRATLSHDPIGDPMGASSAAAVPLYEFTMRHDSDSGSFFMNGSRIMSGPGASTQDSLKLIASKMAAGYRQSVALNLDKFTAKDIFNAQMQAYKGSYVDPLSAATPGFKAKVNSETYFGKTFDPANYSEDSGPFSINGQHYFSRTQKMHGPSVEGMYPSLEGSMWSYAPDGSLMFANPKADTHVDPVTQQLIIDNDNATKFIKHAQKRGTGDIGRLIDPMTGREIAGSESRGYRTDPLTGRIIRDQGYDLNYFIPVGGGELNMGQVAQYRDLNFQIDRTMTITGPHGTGIDTVGQLPYSVTGQYHDIPGSGRTTGQWDRADIARDRAQIYSSRDFGDTAYVPITMTIAAAGNTAQGHSGIKGYNVAAPAGTYGAPAGMDFGIAANAIKDPIAWANANISGNMDYLLAQGKSLKEAVGMLGLTGIYNMDTTKGPLGYNQSDMSNYGAIRQSYQNIVGASWNQAQGGIVARVNTNIGKFGAWQWGQPGLPSEDMPKLASMDPAYYNRVNAYTSVRQDPYAEIFNSGVAMGLPGRAGFTARTGVEFDDTLSSVLSGALSQYNGTANASQLTDALGHALDALGLSKNSPITLGAQARNEDGSMRDVNLRLPSHRNQAWSQNKRDSLSGMDENGAPEEMKYARMNENISEYSNLASRILQQKMYGGVIDPVDAARYVKLSDDLSHSEGILRKAQQMYLPGSAGGPVFGDKAISRNVVALGDRKIAQMFRIDENDPDAGAKLTQAKALLTTGNEAAYYTLYPHLSQNKMLRLQAIPMDSIKGMSVGNMPDAIGVHPRTQSQLDKDTDVDAALVALSSRYEWDESSRQYRVAEAGQGPMSIKDLNKRNAGMMLTGGGEAEYRKWFDPKTGDISHYDTMDKLKSHLGNLMPEHMAMISSQNIQFGGYIGEAKYKWRMGEFYNMARKSMAITGFNEMSARMWEPYYQAALDKTPLSEQKEMGYQILRSLQPATAGFKSGEADDGEAILGSYRMGKGSGMGTPGMNKAMSDIVLKLWTGEGGGGSDPDSIQPEFIEQLFPGVDPARMASYRKIMAANLKNGPAMAGNLLFGSMPWTNAATIGGPLLALKAMISRRHKQKNVAGFLIGDAQSPEDTAWTDMGESAESLKDVMRSKFDTTEEAVAALQNSLVQTESGKGGGIPMGSYLGGVYQRLGLVDAKGNPRFRALEGFSKSLGFEIPGNPPEHTNPALGPGVYLTARIQPEESKLLRGLEAIGRTDPLQARDISNWLGSHADSANVSSLHIYSNLAVNNPPPAPSQYSIDQLKTLDMMHDAIKLGINAQAQLADERIRNNLNMPAQQADVVMQAISNVTQGRYVNPATLVKTSGLQPQNEVFDAIMRVQGGMAQGVNGNQLGTFQHAATQLAAFSLHQQDRALKQDFRQELGTSAGRFGTNAITSYEDLAAILGTSGTATPEQMKTGMSYGGSMSYSFGGSASLASAAAPIDPQTVALTSRAFAGLRETMQTLGPLAERLAKAHGEDAKALQEQIGPLEKAKDGFLGAIKSIGEMGAIADKRSGGDASKRDLVMSALGANRMAEITGAEASLGSYAPRAEQRGGLGGMWDKMTSGISDLSEGRNPLGKFLRNGQIMNGIELFALNRLDKAFTNQAIGGTLAGAQRDASYEAVLAGSGYSAPPTGVMASAGKYQNLQNVFQRQEAATWSPVVGGVSDYLSGGNAGIASIIGSSLAGAALGGFSGFSLGGPVTGLLGAAVGGIGTAVVGTASRQRFLADNPAFAATDAFKNLSLTMGGNVPTTQDQFGRTVVDQARMQQSPAYQAAMAGAFGIGDFSSINKPVYGPPAPMYGPPTPPGYAPELSGVDAGANYNAIAMAGAPRAQMNKLTAAGRLEVTGQVVQDLGKQGWSPALAQQAFQQNQFYFGGGNANMNSLLYMGMAGVNIDQGAQALASLNGGSIADYGTPWLQYQNHPDRFQNSMMGLGSQFSGFMSSIGQGLSPQQSEAFNARSKPLQNLLTALGGQASSGFAATDSRGLQGTANYGQIADLLKNADPVSIAKARQMLVAGQQSASPATSAYDSTLGFGGTVQQATDLGNAMAGSNLQSFGAAQGLAGTMMGLGMSASNYGSVVSGATSSGVGFSRVMGNALAGDPNAMSMMGYATGNNSLITRETSAWGGRQGLPLYSTTLGVGTVSPMNSMRSLFGPQLDPGGMIGPGAQNAMINGGPNITGQSYGGLWGAQDYTQNQSWNLQLGSIGIGFANATRSMAFASGSGLSNYTNIFTGKPFQEGQGSWALEDKGIALSQEMQRAQVGFQLQSNALATSQYLQTDQFNRGVRGQQFAWQKDDMSVQHSTSLLQRSWGQQDWAYGKNISARDYGWQQEDFNTNIRRAQGFERHQLEKEKGRSTIAYDTTLTHENTVESRQKQLWHIEDQQYDKQVKRAQQVYDTDMKRMDMEKRQFLERQALEASHAAAQLGWINEQADLQKQQNQLSRTQFKLANDAEKSSLGNQAAGVANEKTRFAIEQGIARQQQVVADSLQSRMTAEAGFYDSIKNWFEKMKAWIDSGATGSGPSAPTPPKIKTNTGLGNNGGAAVGYQGLPRDITVGEFGPEVVKNNGRWMTVSPTLPSFDSNSTRGTGTTQPGNVYVILDGELIAAKMVTRSSKKLNRDRKR